MPDWIVVLSIAGGAAAAAAIVHGVVGYRRLIREETALAQPLTSLSVAAWRQARKIVVLLLGGSVILVGVALIVLPGPASIVIPLGIGILAIEFAWARRWLRHLRVHLHLSAKRSKRFFRRKGESEGKRSLES